MSRLAGGLSTVLPAAFTSDTGCFSFTDTGSDRTLRIHPIRRAVAWGAVLILIQRTLSRPAAPLRGVRTALSAPHLTLSAVLPTACGGSEERPSRKGACRDGLFFAFYRAAAGKSCPVLHHNLTFSQFLPSAVRFRALKKTRRYGKIVPWKKACFCLCEKAFAERRRGDGRFAGTAAAQPAGGCGGV